MICYRVYLGDSHQGPDLGEGALTAKVGQVTTPASTIVIITMIIVTMIIIR